MAYAIELAVEHLNSGDQVPRSVERRQLPFDSPIIAVKRAEESRVRRNGLSRKGVGSQVKKKAGTFLGEEKRMVEATSYQWDTQQGN